MKSNTRRSSRTSRSKRSARNKTSTVGAYLPGHTEEVERIPFGFVAPKSNTNSNYSITPLFKLKDEDYVFPKSITATVCSDSTTFIRLVAFVSGKIDNNNIIAQTPIVIVGQVPKKIRLSISKKTLSRVIGTFDSNGSDKDSGFELQSSGGVKCIGQAVFFHGRGFPIPTMPTVSDNVNAELLVESPIRIGVESDYSNGEEVGVAPSGPPNLSNFSF